MGWSHLFFVVNVNGKAVFEPSAGLLEPAEVEVLAPEASDPHVPWLVCQVLVSQLAWALSNDAVVEWLGLVELLSVLGSLLVGVSIFFSCPAGAVPEGRVHYVARAIIEQSLPRAVEIGLVSHVLLEFYSLLHRELLGRITASEYRFGLSFGVHETGSEGRLVRLVLRVIMGVGLRHSLRPVSPRGGIKGVIRRRNPLGIESVRKYL